jgi:hypothetical protein
MQGNSIRDYLGQLVPFHLFSPNRLDRELVADFFMLFARAEYALKKAGFIKPRGDEGFDVDWDRFARSLATVLTSPDDPQITEAVRYMQERAPQKQVFRGGRLSWKNRVCPDATDPVFVVRSITTVRNNLFHGGKEIVGLMAERDRQLLQHSLLVLAYCLTVNAEVLDAFGELGPETAVAQQ